ncbi:PBS lyase HEAT-like repeat-containing protein [Enterobacter sp. BIGb0383]|uniref:HEAT repeat domain-containing protein n=1 Tax=unclassified Enterobacter TaxID=2608935 RepID=UPI000F48B4D6|nr:MULTISPECIES: HEAT repeat domain-containing protein [unclassified Enterobacter]ROP59945.1 PBS lyase HEAT-like repeat-containing protein [Enterobacter sp. BIGb0383]ROS08586.1 PBS lyase HEAT-like repeat-containing protein [Enterobacter sp. BIGb0359]
MNENNTMLLEGFYSQKISGDELKERFSLEGKSTSEFISNLLIEASDNKDPDLLEDGITLIFIFKDVRYPIKELNSLLLESWHYKHEDIASLLQDAKSPTSIDALNKAIVKKFDYLDFDDSYALAVKCIWALGEIGTPEAIDKLTKLSISDNDVIRDNAINQLKRHRLL